MKKMDDPQLVRYLERQQRQERQPGVISQIKYRKMNCQEKVIEVCTKEKKARLFFEENRKKRSLTWCADNLKAVPFFMDEETCCVVNNGRCAVCYAAGKVIHETNPSVFFLLSANVS